MNIFTRKTRNTRLVAVLSVLLIAAFALAACGGGSGETPTDGEGATDDGSIAIELSDDFSFSPNPIEVTQGEEVTLALNNSGAQEHDLVIDEFNVDSGRVAGGESSTVTFTPDKSGTFKVYCSVPGHEAAGMTAELVVSE